MKSKYKDTGTPSGYRKDLKSALMHFFKENISALSGDIICEPVVNKVIDMVDKYLPVSERMRPGQTLWYAVDIKEKSGYGKKIEDCNIIPVILDLINEEDIEKYINKVSKRKRQTAVAVRLHTQAYKQGAVMSYSDTAAIMRLSPSTVGSYIREFEKETGESVPRRGNVHDLGPTLTHKRQICMKHLIQGKSVEQTARETFHSTAAVVRYANDYKRVYTCLKGGWDLNKIKTATGLSESLTKEYIDLIEENSMN